MNYLLSNPPNDNYSKFFDQMKEHETLPLKDWKYQHILGYFCKKYFCHYNSIYVFKYNSSAPSKCFEVFQIKKLISQLSSDPEILQKYIDQVFETKVKSSKRKLTSISFLTNEATLKSFKFQKLLTIKRTDLLPDNILEILNKNNFNIKTYGDFAFYNAAAKTNSLPKNDADNLYKIKCELMMIGFDLSILDKIK